MELQNQIKPSPLSPSEQDILHINTQNHQDMLAEEKADKQKVMEELIDALSAEQNGTFTHAYVRVGGEFEWRMHVGDRLPPETKIPIFKGMYR